MADLNLGEIWYFYKNRIELSIINSNFRLNQSFLCLEHDIIITFYCWWDGWKGFVQRFRNKNALEWPLCVLTSVTHLTIIG